MALLVTVVVLQVGCPKIRPPTDAVTRPPALEPLHIAGQRVLVVPGATAPPEMDEIARHLSVLPWRITVPAEYGVEEAQDWETWADERRIPFLLVLSRPADESLPADAADGHVILEAALVSSARGETLHAWTVGPCLPAALPVELRLVLHAEMGLGENRPDGHPTSWITCGVETLERLRVATVVEPGEATRELVRQHGRGCPLDTALVELDGVLTLHLGQEPEGRRFLKRVQAMTPQGPSQLPVLARMAGRSGMEERSLWLAELAAEQWPGRLDMALTLAGLYDELEDFAGAEDVLLGAAAGLDHGEPPSPEELIARPDRDALEAQLALTADLRYSLGWAFQRQGKGQAAIASYSEGRDLFELIDEPFSTAACENNLGVAMIEANRPVAAIAPLRRALEIRGQTEATLEEATTTYNLAAAYEALGRGREAAATMQTAASRYAEAGAADAQFDTLMEVIQLHGENESNEDVERVFQRVLLLVEGHEEERRLRARALDSVGVARGRVGRFDESLEALEEALGIWAEIGDRLHEGQSRYNMAIPYLGMHDMEKALDMLEMARTIAEELEDLESVHDIDQQIQQIEKLR